MKSSRLTLEFKLFIKRLLRKVGIVLASFFLLVGFFIYRDLYADFGINKDAIVKYNFHNISDFSIKKLSRSKIKYNTFIFGSSRSIPLYACYIKHRVFNDNNQIIPFHFANWGERIGGICKKLEYLDAKGYSLKKIFILLDNNICFNQNGDTKLDESHVISGIPWLNGASNHFLYFFYYSGDKLPINLRILFGLARKSDYMFVDKLTNDLNHHCPKNLKFESIFHTSQHVINLRKELPKRIGFAVKQPDRINNNVLNYLKRIKKIIDKHRSNYVIIYSPMYNQRIFGSKDNQILYQFFKGHIVDFSGVNKLTNSWNEYADIAHYYPSIGKKMIDSLANTNLFN